MSNENSIKILEDINVNVKWFSCLRGYGFVVCDEVPGDIFLHFSLLSSFGCQAVDAGDTLLCNLAITNRGHSVSEIKAINVVKDRTSIDKLEVCEGMMKWFNPVKGFGFATSTIDGRDIFIPGAILKKIGIESIQPGQKLMLKIYNTEKGGEAKDIAIVD